MSNVPFVSEAELERYVNRLVAERGTQHALTLLDAMQRVVGGLVLQLREREKGDPNQPRDRNGRWTASGPVSVAAE